MNSALSINILYSENIDLTLDIEKRAAAETLIRTAQLY